MLSSLFDSTTLPLLEQAARFGERRQEVLAGNIANIDTPEYRRRDLPVEAFRTALKEAVSARDASGGKANSAFPDELFRAIEPPPARMTFQDGNDRGIEHEVMEMTKNTMMQSFAVEMMAAQLSMLEAVASERA
ncbi:MAG: hypothetical protein WD066_05155 [Planctomycetaceae bacterium]